MARFRVRVLTVLLLLSPWVGGGLLASCSAANYSSVGKSEAEYVAPLEGAPQELLKAQADSAVTSPSDSGQVSRQRPQLIKRAEMVLTVETTVTEAVEAITKVVTSHQGDLLDLRDRIPANPSQRQVATLKLRIPQAKLDQALTDLAALGEVQSRAITAEDVSNQLVDLQARLKNLRRSEERVRKIMDRSGSIADVLKVSQELSNIRSSIEQIDAQFQGLKNQVAFSTIDVTVQDAIAANARQPALGDHLQDTWTHATRSVSDLTKGLLALGIWLLAFSPYWITLLLVGGFGRHILLRKLPQKQPSLPPEGSQK